MIRCSALDEFGRSQIAVVILSELCLLCLMG